MIEDFKELDKDKKDLMINNEELTKNFLIMLLRQAYGDDKDKPFTLNDYDLYTYILFNVSEENTLNKDGELTSQFKELYETLLNNDMINNAYNEYTKLAINESKQLLYTLSRLLYLQDKYKDEEIGQKIDAKIKEWLDLIKTFDEEKDTSEYTKGLLETTTDKKARTKIIGEYNRKINARLLYQIIPSLNYDIYNLKNKRDYTTLWNYDKITNEDFIGFLDNYINNKISDSETYDRYNNDINTFINDLENNINMLNFEVDKAKEIQAIKDKYNVTFDKIKNEKIPQEKQDAFLDEIASLYQDYLKDNKFNIQDDKDVKIWRDKADNFIKHLETYDGIALLGLFTMDYTLKHLAYSDYQKEAYKLDLEDDIKVIEAKDNDQETPVNKPKKLNAKELKEKYKDITLLDDDDNIKL